jgi:hypothetical protein
MTEDESRTLLGAESALARRLLAAAEASLDRDR